MVDAPWLKLQIFNLGHFFIYFFVVPDIVKVISIIIKSRCTLVKALDFKSGAFFLSKLSINSGYY